MKTAISTNTAPGDELRALQAQQADKIDVPRLAEWLRPLNASCARPLEEAEFRKRVVAVLPMVADLPASIFTIDSARRVGSMNFPSAAAIRRALASPARLLNDRIASLQERRETARPIPRSAIARERPRSPADDRREIEAVRAFRARQASMDRGGR